MSSLKINYLSRTKVNNLNENPNNDRMQKLAEKLGKITTNIESDKSNKFDTYEQKTMNLYNTIEENKNNNNAKFNDIKEHIIVIQKTLKDDAAKREASHKEFIEFMKKMEEKIFEKFDNELNAKREIEAKVSNYLNDKITEIKGEIENQSKIRYESIENLENYLEKELPKMQGELKSEQNEREESDDSIIQKLSEEVQKTGNVINNEKKNREETQEGILEMIKIMNERMKSDLSLERKEREQNEEVLIDVLENTCNRLQQSTKF